jgi:hypothetical protein
VSTLKVDSVQRNLVLPAVIKTDKGKVAVRRVFDREKLNSFPTVNGGFDFDFVHGKRKIEFLGERVNNYFDYLRKNFSSAIISRCSMSSHRTTQRTEQSKPPPKQSMQAKKQSLSKPQRVCKTTKKEKPPKETNKEEESRIRTVFMARER